MTETTALDAAHAEMQAAPQDDASRLKFFERLSDSELFLMLTEEARDENISPEVFDVAVSYWLLTARNDWRNSRVVPYPMWRCLAGYCRQCWQGRGSAWG